MAIKNVLLVGAAGSLGQHILPALTESFTVTVLARAGSSSTKSLPSHVKVATASADYTVDELVPIVKGQDAVVSALGGEALMGGAQTRLAEAAAKAGGVQLFMPGEFGSIPPAKWYDLIPFFGLKKGLREAVAATGLQWTGVANGAFFEWGLDTQFLKIDVGNRKATVLDDGEVKFSATRMATIGRAVAAALSKPDVAPNRIAVVQSFLVSQNDIIRALEKEMGVKFEVEHVDSKAFVEESKEKFAKGDMAGLYGLICACGVTDGNFEADGHSLDNKALGLPADDLETAVKEYVKSKSG